MKLEQQIEKIIENMFGDTHVEINSSSKRGPNRYLAPLTLKFKTYEIMDYLLSFENIIPFLNDCKAEKEIYESYFYPNSTIDLLDHKFWKKETNPTLAENYQSLMHSAFILNKHSKKSRNNIATNNYTCISYFQEICGDLVVVSRSCDFSLGFLADLYLICAVAQANECSTITWVHSNLHTYLNNADETKKQYTTKIKYDKFNFNVR